MSADQLAGLDAKRAFFPRGRFHELPVDYVPFDDLTSSSSVDTRIDRALRAEAGCVTVVGPSGAGKSAAIAAAVERVKDQFPCLRIPVAAIGEVAGTPVAFGQHILRETVQQAGALFAAHQREDLQAATLERSTTRRAPQGITARLRGGTMDARRAGLPSSYAAKKPVPLGYSRGARPLRTARCAHGSR